MPDAQQTAAGNREEMSKEGHDSEHHVSAVFPSWIVITA